MRNTGDIKPESIWNLHIMSPSAGDVGSQKCHMGTVIISQLGAQLGSHVLVRFPHQLVICSVWLKTELQTTAVELDKCVYQTLSNLDQSEDNVTLHIRSLNTCIGDSIEVTVITEQLSDVQKFRSEIYREKLQQMCSNCLYRLCIKKNFIVNLENSKLGKLYGIYQITIQKCFSASQEMEDTDSFALTVGKETKILINDVQSKERFVQLSSRQNWCLGGMEQTVQLLIDLVKLPLQLKEDFHALGISPPKGVLLHGPPGCGKTSLVKHVAHYCHAYLISVNGPEIVSPHPGESENNLRKVFDKAFAMSSEGACIVFLDEIDSICPKKTGSGSNEFRLTSQLMTILDGLGSRSKVLVIGATNRPAALDPALRRPGRLDREVLVNIPTADQRHAILKIYASSLPLDEDVDLCHLAELTNGYVGSDLALLIQEVAIHAFSEYMHKPEKITLLRVGMKHFLCALKKISPSLHRGADGLTELRPINWEDIGGLTDVKQRIIQTIEWPLKYPESFERLGLPHPRGVLLYGPPGCCKTTLVRAVATSCHITFLSLSGAQLYSPFVGQSERMVTEIFQRARACSPSIIFFDEIDSIVGKRSESSGGHSVQQRVLSCLLNEMDGIGIRLDDKTNQISRSTVCEESPAIHESLVGNGVNRKQRSVDNRQVYVIAATNRPDLIDEALLRPGRIDSIIYVPPPDKEARRDILSVFTKQMPLTGVNLDMLAEKTELFTGADLENLCREAALNALTEKLDAVHVEERHFFSALQGTKPSLTAKLLQQYSHIKHKSGGIS